MASVNVPAAAEDRRVREDQPQEAEHGLFEFEDIRPEQTAALLEELKVLYRYN
jgi:hypothetical protein